MDILKKNLKEAAAAIEKFSRDEKQLKAVEEAGELLIEAFRTGNKIISCGNGGSMCDAMHFAEELSGKFRNNRPGIAAISISDPSHITCVGNDFGFEAVFSRYVESVGREHDVLLAISTSGNSLNVNNAAKIARAKGMKVIGLTGKTGGELATLCDVEIRAPHSEYADRAQEIHIKVIHSLIEYMEFKLF